MNTFNIFQPALVLHITGIVMMVGVTLADFSAYSQLKRFIPHEKERAIHLYRAARYFPLLMGIGGVLIVLSGITMMVAVKGVFMGQLWFRIKLAVLLLIIANFLLTGRSSQIQLRKWLAAPAEVVGGEPGITAITKRLTLFYSIQLAFFGLIFILSVFRFN
jgi:uncharacterized membrane protein